jgi:PTH1 family peptidyl-tRNA hydrolase
MKIILGIGNPGQEYERTRHNVGFRVVDRLSNGSRWNNKFQGLVSETHVCDDLVLLVKPLTYVNLSGQCARIILDYYKLSPEFLLVVVDDVSLPLGKLRLRPKGSSGCHKGMISLISSLSTEEFHRLRIGIGSNEGQPLSSYVLSKFSQAEEKILETSLSQAVDACMTWLREGIHVAMNRFNTITDL